MKKNYNIPTTETSVIRAGFICQAASPTSGLNVGGGTLGGGGEVPGGSSIEPM